MDAIITAFHVMAPIFIMMALGFCLQKAGILPETLIRPMNNLVFRVFLPAMLFISIYQMEPATLLNRKLVLFITASTLTVFALALLLIPRFEKDGRRTGVLIQGVIRGNVVYFGIPVVMLLMGKSYVGLTALVVAVVAPLYNIISVIALETFREGRPEPKKVLAGIAKNPMILSVAAAMIFLLGGIPVPEAVMIPLTDLGRVASPLALVLLGGSFRFSSIRGYGREVMAAVLVKLVLVPAVVLPLAAALEFGPGEMAVILVTFGAPTAVASFAMTQQMGGDDVLAGQIVVYSSVCAVFSIFALIVLFKTLGIL